MRQTWTRVRDYDWAKEWKSLFEGILPAHVCETAMATCRLHLRGKDAHRKGAYAMAVHTEMKTYGETPIGVGACQTLSQWIQLTSTDAANVILDCFGLTIEDVFAQLGKPTQTTEMKLNLSDVVIACDADFSLPTTATAVA
jgi:hypothetical protein